MTALPELPADHMNDLQSSLLPAADLNIRVRPAQFARMIGVSKQCVSQWIKQGKVTIGPDGRLNPNKAADEVMRHSDPGRLRAKLLRPLVDDSATLRRQIHERDRQIQTLHARIDYLDGFCREIEDAEQFLIARLVPRRWDTLRALAADQISDALSDLLDEALLAVGNGPELDVLHAETDAPLFAMRDIAGSGQQGGADGTPQITGENQ